jgi:hypothetical protein
VPAGSNDFPLSEKDFEKVEHVAGRCLTELGYFTRSPDNDQDPARLTLRFWEIEDNLRRLCGVMLARGRIFKPNRWSYIARRVRAALKEKVLLRP